MKFLRLGILGTLALVVKFLPALPTPPKFLLPDDVSPTKYTIDLSIDPNRDSFEGWARIEVELRTARNLVWLNAKDLTILEAAILVGGKERTARVEAAAGEFLGLELDAPAGPGPVSARWPIP